MGPASMWGPQHAQTLQDQCHNPNPLKPQGPSVVPRQVGPADGAHTLTGRMAVQASKPLQAGESAGPVLTTIAARIYRAYHLASPIEVCHFTKPLPGWRGLAASEGGAAVPIRLCCMQSAWSLTKESKVRSAYSSSRVLACYCLHNALFQVKTCSHRPSAIHKSNPAI